MKNEKELLGFSFHINIENFEALFQVKKLNTNLYFLKSDGIQCAISAINPTPDNVVIKSRINRNMRKSFGKRKYSFERKNVNNQSTKNFLICPVILWLDLSMIYYLHTTQVMSKQVNILVNNERSNVLSGDAELVIKIQVCL